LAGYVKGLTHEEGKEEVSSRVLLTPCSIARKKPNNSLHSKKKRLAKKQENWWTLSPH
jgi:hypothetical protein